MASPPVRADHVASATPFGYAACYVFGGKEKCRTVRIFDTEECILKVHPQPLPELDPAVSACLRDEAGTRKVYLRKARPRTMSVSGRVSVKGRGVVEVLVRYDDKGAAVWETKNADSFALKGDADRTRKTIERFSSEFCTGESRMVGGGTSGGVIGAKEAYKRAKDGDIVLVDIRLPTEWRETGLGQHAQSITMHQSLYTFVDRLKAAAGPGKKPIALMCAEGVRSAAMQRTLKQFGFKGVIDVREGMMGGKAGPGWIKQGLPVRPYTPE